MTLSKPLAAVVVLIVGIGLSGMSVLVEPDHFTALANQAEPPISATYQRCLEAKGFGHHLKPLTLREFCGAWVFSGYLHPVEDKPPPTS